MSDLLTDNELNSVVINTEKQPKKTRKPKVKTNETEENNTLIEQNEQEKNEKPIEKPVFKDKITIKPKIITRTQPDLISESKIAQSNNLISQDVDNDIKNNDISSMEFSIQSQNNQSEKSESAITNQDNRHFEKQKRFEKNDNYKNGNNNENNRDQQNEPEAHYPYPVTEDVVQAKHLKSKSVQELTKIAEFYNIENAYRMLKQEMIASILRQAAYSGKLIYSEGTLEINHDGHGFLRSQSENYFHCPDDVFIANTQIRKFGLRYGDSISGYVRAPKKGERYFSLLRLTEVNGRPSDIPYNKINFENLIPLYPREKLNFEISTDKKDGISTRIIDLISPIGKGQRALIVAQPKSGKTMLMQSIAKAIETNHPEVYLIYLGIDERPEEFTEMQRTIKGEVVSSTFDEPAHRHVALAEIVIEKSKRLVEQGRDVVILLDSITRLARAYNNYVPSSGKILSGGVDSNALHKPKRFFGAARNIENGGSLTIIATALVETGSKMDEVIFEEFKGTGNCEIVLDRKIADRRVFPAIDVLKSGTRKEEEMVDPEMLTKMWMLRRIITGMGGSSGGTSHEALEFLMKKIKETKDNKEFFLKMNSVGG